MDRINRIAEHQDQESHLHEEVTGKILGAAFSVLNELGAAFLEAVYEGAMVVALEELGIRVQRQVPLKVRFRGVIVGHYVADLLVGEAVIVELKAVSRLLPEHKAQVINYLKATHTEVGLLLNFGNPKLEYHRLHP
jgi:GxxExxY protein